MPKVLVKSDGYKTLVKKIVKEFEELEFFVKNRIAKVYWNVGQYIAEHLLARKDKSQSFAEFYLNQELLSERLAVAYE